MQSEKMLTAAEAWAMGESRPSQEQAMALWEKMQLPGGAGKAARDRLFYLFEPMVGAVVVRSYAKSHSSVFEDLVQEGYIGLLEAIDSYSPERGTRFSGYAWCHIEWRLKAVFPGMTCMIAMPVRHLRLRRKAFGVKSRLLAELGREPSVAEIADACGAEPGLVEAVMQVQAVSADGGLDPEGGCLLATIADPGKSPEEQLEMDRLPAMTARLIEKLKPPSREVVVRHLGLDGSDPMSFKDLADERGAVRQTTSCAFRAAVKQLRQHVQA